MGDLLFYVIAFCVALVVVGVPLLWGAMSGKSEQAVPESERGEL